MNLQQHILHTPEGNLAYQSTGSGKAVVLLHGFGADSRIWEQQAQLLAAQGYRLLLPDLPGSGASPLPQNTSITIEWLAAKVHALLEHEQITKCILLGHSMGGYITLAFAEKWPERLQGFGLIHSTAFADSDEKKEARRKSSTFIRENGSNAFLEATLPNLFGTRFQQQHPEAIRQLLEWGTQFTAEALIAYYEAMLQRPDRSEVLRNTKLPVLFFIGAADKAVPPDDAVLQSSYPAIAVVEKISGIAHMGMWEATDELNTLLLQFLQLIEAINHASNEQLPR